MKNVTKYARIIRDLRERVSPEIIRQLYLYAPTFEGVTDMLDLYDRETDVREKQLTLLALLDILKDIHKWNRIEIK